MLALCSRLDGILMDRDVSDPGRAETLLRGDSVPSVQITHPLREQVFRELEQHPKIVRIS